MDIRTREHTVKIDDTDRQYFMHAGYQYFLDQFTAANENGFQFQVEETRSPYPEDNIVIRVLRRGSEKFVEAIPEA